MGIGLRAEASSTTRPKLSWSGSMRKINSVLFQWKKAVMSRKSSNVLPQVLRLFRNPSRKSLARNFFWTRNCGTGMRASVHCDLAGWTKEGLPALKARCEELKLQPRGTRGESGGQTGITYDISN